MTCLLQVILCLSSTSSLSKFLCIPSCYHLKQSDLWELNLMEIFPHTRKYQRTIMSQSFPPQHVPSNLLRCTNFYDHRNIPPGSLSYQTTQFHCKESSTNLKTWWKSVCCGLGFFSPHCAQLCNCQVFCKSKNMMSQSHKESTKWAIICGFHIPFFISIIQFKIIVVNMHKCQV